MRFITVPTALSTAFLVGLVSHTVFAFPGHDLSARRHRKNSILNNPNAQPNLPTAPGAAAAAAAASLDLNNIQGDILVGMKKKKELFFFFSISDVGKFKTQLRKTIHDRITTTSQLLDVEKQPTTAVNIAFSQSGLTALQISDSLQDSAYSSGQFADAEALGDPDPDTSGNWIPQFKGTDIHGVFLLASDTWENVNSTLAAMQSTLRDCIVQQYSLRGAARPGDQEGHEHFGFMDGISQPAVDGFTTHPTPGQTVIAPGVILLGENGDLIQRPGWAKDGSFLAFRQMQQLVPEFNKFLNDNPIKESGLTPEQGSALLGARMVGRWKSGAPVDLAPLFDDPVLGADPNRNNNFTYAHPGEDLQSNQTRCPFSAHTRKTAPRADFNPVNTRNQIIRSGIPYGPEVTPQEAKSSVSNTDRGLAFVSYQSNLDDGFRFIQLNWANNANFMFGKNDTTPGVDPIVGALQGGQRVISGLDPTDASRDMTLVNDFVVSRGGEYFFSPSLAAIAGKLSDQ